MSKRAAVPVVNTGNPGLDRFAEAVKQNMDAMTGQQQNVAQLQPLPSNATLADVIARCNALLVRLQGS